MSLLQGAIDSVMKNEQSCRIALGGPATFGGAPTPSAQTYDGISPAEIRLYQNDGVTPFLSSSSPYNTFGMLTILGITLTPIRLVPGATNVYFSQLTISGKKPSGASLGGALRFRRDIKLSVMIDASNRIVSCSSLTFLGSDQQPLPVCAGDQGLYSNGLQIRCVKMVCPAGQSIIGFQSDGSVICG